MNDTAKSFLLGMATAILLALAYAAFHTDRPTFRVTVFSSPDADTCYTYSTTDTAGLHIYDSKFYIITEKQ